MDTRALESIAASFRSAFQTVEEMTTHFVREAILQGIYRPGERLQQDAIAALLGVSRMPVRASLRKLETEGLVEFSPHRGATVRLLSTGAIAEVYELRVLLESRLLEAAAPRLDPEVLAELDGVARWVQADGRSSDWIQRRRHFYERLYELAELPRTAQIVAELRTEVGPYLAMRHVEHEHHHLVVLDALREGDVDAAKAALRSHLEGVSKELQDIVAQLSPTG